jgi:hypothetical protein
MPLWKLQTVGSDRLSFLYPDLGKGNRIELRGEAVYCLRRFRDLIGDMAETAWVRFVRRLPRNQALLGEGPDLREFLFGSDRSALDVVRDLGHNFVLADAPCNGGKLDRLASFEHLDRWCTRNARRAGAGAGLGRGAAGDGALVAAFVPTRRALAVEPARALRAE